MASRRITLPDGSQTRIDHGAQFASARDAEAQAAFQAAGALSWYRDRLVGAPSVRAIPETLLSGIDVQLETEIAEISAGTVGVSLTDTAGEELGTFDHVICTAPVPQTRKLVPDAVETLTPVSVAPCWALMLVFEERWDVGADLFEKDTAPDPFSWIAREGAKPGRDESPDRWIAHAGPEWSTENLELSKEEAAAQLVDALQAGLSSPMPTPVYTAAHRWRYARTQTALGQPFVALPRNKIILAGDWCLGARVEAGFRSGRLAAEYLLGLPRE